MCAEINGLTVEQLMAEVMAQAMTRMRVLEWLSEMVPPECFPGSSSNPKLSTSLSTNLATLTTLSRNSYPEENHHAVETTSGVSAFAKARGSPVTGSSSFRAKAQVWGRSQGHCASCPLHPLLSKKGRGFFSVKGVSQFHIEQNRLCPCSVLKFFLKFLQQQQRHFLGQLLVTLGGPNGFFPSPAFLCKVCSTVCRTEMLDGLTLTEAAVN